MIAGSIVRTEEFYRDKGDLIVGTLALPTDRPFLVERDFAF